MKKLLLIVILAAGFQQLKAQSLGPLPDMKLNDGLTSPFKLKKSDPLAPYDKLTAPADSSASNIPAILNPNDIVVYSNMPIARLPVSNDHMPIVNTAQNGMHYDMLVKKVLVNPAPAAGKAAP
jgi:hypothetical protein